MGISIEQYRESVGKFCSNFINRHSLQTLYCSTYKSNSSQYFDLVCVQALSVLMTIQLLLAMAGDIESNPGPINDDSEFCDVAICHINIRSLKPTVDNVFYKMEIIRHEIAPRYQIITLSETWLNDSDCLNDFGIDGFQKPFINKRRVPVNGHCVS